MNDISLAGKVNFGVEAKNNSNGLPALEKVMAVCDVVLWGKNDSSPDLDVPVKESGRLSKFKKRETSAAEGKGT